MSHITLLAWPDEPVTAVYRHGVPPPGSREFTLFLQRAALAAVCPVAVKGVVESKG